MTRDAFAGMHGRHHATLLDALSGLDPAGVGTYRARGVIPPSTAVETAPVRLRRRRVRR